MVATVGVHDNPHVGVATDMAIVYSVIGSAQWTLACNSIRVSDADQCDYYTCLGCTDEEACNYDETATIDAEDCIYPTEDRDCDGNCYVDTDGDGVCDGGEVLGCTYPQATNYNPFATEENGSCVFDGVTDVFGCIYPSACNFNPEAPTGRASRVDCSRVPVRLGQRRHLQPV